MTENNPPNLSRLDAAEIIQVVRDLTNQVNGLNSNVSELSTNLHTTREQVEKTENLAKQNEVTSEQATSAAKLATEAATDAKAAVQSQGNLMKITLGFCILSFLAMVGVGWLALEVRQNAVSGCQTGNNRTEAQREAWGYIIDSSLKNPTLTKNQILQIEEFRTWINASFANRDCSQLDKVQKLPPRPALLEPQQPATQGR